MERHQTGEPEKNGEEETTSVTCTGLEHILFPSTITYALLKYRAHYD